MARVNLNEVEQKDRLICVEKSAIDEAGGEAMFDAAGQPTEKWKAIDAPPRRIRSRSRARSRDVRNTRRIRGFQHAGDVDEGKGRPFCAAHGHAPCRRAEPREPERRAAQEPLVRKGYLARIYMHLLSLQNFGRLLDRNGRTA